MKINDIVQFISGPHKGFHGKVLDVNWMTGMAKLDEPPYVTNVSGWFNMSNLQIILAAGPPSPYSSGPTLGAPSNLNPPPAQLPLLTSGKNGDTPELRCICKGPRFLDDPHQKDCLAGTT